jgi:ribosome-associated protein
MMPEFTRELAMLAMTAADDKKGEGIITLDVAELLVVTEYFVIATGRTNIQVRAIADEVEERLRDEGGVKPIGREGEGENKWVLLDYGDLVVHVFQPEERDFYRLERLWSDAPRIELPGSAPSSVGGGATQSSDDEPSTAAANQ